MIHKVWVPTFEHRAHCIKQQIIGSALAINLQRHVGNDLLQFAFELQDSSGHHRVIGPNVYVHKRIGQDSIEGTPKRTQGAHNVANCHAHREWRKHVVEIAEIHRVPSDRWHLRVHRH